MRTVMHVMVDEKTREYIRQARQTKTEIITEAHLAPLPELVQRYRRYAQVLDQLLARRAIPRPRCPLGVTSLL